jgi:hypothetical protein
VAHRSELNHFIVSKILIGAGCESNDGVRTGGCVGFNAGHAEWFMAG